jgi:hypothetical protein
LPRKATQIDCILFFRSENFWNLPTKAAQIDGILFCRSEKLWNLPTKATQIDCILFCCAAKDFGICQQTQLKLTFFFLLCSEKL